MGCAKASPIIVQVFATLVLIGGICLTLTAILTHSWQNFTTSDTVKSEVHKHGLWMDCIEERFVTTGSHTQTCFYKFHSEDQFGHNHMSNDHSGHNHGSGQFQNNFQNNNNNFQNGFPNQQGGGGHQHQHKVLSLPSRKSILALLCVAVALGMVGLLFSFCAPCVKWCSVIWASLSLVSTVLSMAGIIVFFINSHDFERSYSSASARTTQAHGFSFYCGVIGCAVFLFATILAVLTTVLYFATSRRDDDYSGKNANKTWPKIYNHHNTAV